MGQEAGTVYTLIQLYVLRSCAKWVIINVCMSRVLGRTVAHVSEPVDKLP